MLKMCLTLCRNFELPWLDDRSRCRIEVPKKHTPHRTCRKWCIGGQEQPRRWSSCTNDKHKTSKKKQNKTVSRFPGLCDMYCLCTTRGQHAKLRRSSFIEHIVRSTLRARRWPIRRSRRRQSCSSTCSKQHIRTTAASPRTRARERSVCLAFCATAEQQTVGFETIFSCLSLALQLEPSSHSVVLCGHTYGLLTVASISLWSCEPRPAWYWEKDTIDPIWYKVNYYCKQVFVNWSDAQCALPHLALIFLFFYDANCMKSI